jgi:hypothetical protein
VNRIVLFGRWVFSKGCWSVFAKSYEITHAFHFQSLNDRVMKSPSGVNQPVASNEQVKVVTSYTRH